MLKHFIISLLFIILFVPFVTSGQKIEILSQRLAENKLYRIEFKLKGKYGPYKKYKIVPGLILSNGFCDYQAAKSISGFSSFEVEGNHKSISDRKEIYWDIYADNADSLLFLDEGFKLKLKLVANKTSSPIYWSASFSGNSDAPYGLAFHRLGNWGFYASFKTLNLPKKIDAEVADDGILEQNSIYYYDTRSYMNSYAVNAGLIRRAGIHTFLYLGTGYGAKQLLWKRLDAIEEDGVLKEVGHGWVVNQSKNHHGALAEFGLLWRLRSLVADLGIGSINGKTLYANFGLGYVFKRI